MNIVKSVGKDVEGIHYYLFFGYLYVQLEDEKRHQIRDHIASLVQFIASRKRKWALIYFHSPELYTKGPINLIINAFNELSAED